MNSIVVAMEMSTLAFVPIHPMTTTDVVVASSNEAHSLPRAVNAVDWRTFEEEVDFGDCFFGVVRCFRHSHQVIVPRPKDERIRNSSFFESLGSQERCVIVPSRWVSPVI